MSVGVKNKDDDPSPMESCVAVEISFAFILHTASEQFLYSILLGFEFGDIIPIDWVSTTTKEPSLLFCLTYCCGEEAYSYISQVYLCERE